ncbi:hypothetical protein L6452_31835 [Arctium lappa]|uniref:Uncharacterized protein n=1 Tax=Arctium lappa TaxID=4217 RepID=A0ACB8Z2Z5_ARCLA|nr:hypothetical protein L6452_31835 [Arctium lappa]
MVIVSQNTKKWIRKIIQLINSNVFILLASTTRALKFSSSMSLDLNKPGLDNRIRTTVTQHHDRQLLVGEDDMDCNEGLTASHEVFLRCLWVIDIVAGGKSKKTKRTAPDPMISTSSSL